MYLFTQGSHDSVTVEGGDRYTLLHADVGKSFVEVKVYSQWCPLLVAFMFTYAIVVAISDPELPGKGVDWKEIAGIRSRGDVRLELLIKECR